MGRRCNDAGRPGEREVAPAPPLPPTPARPWPRHLQRSLTEHLAEPARRGYRRRRLRSSSHLGPLCQLSPSDGRGGAWRGVAGRGGAWWGGATRGACSQTCFSDRRAYAEMRRNRRRACTQVYRDTHLSTRRPTLRSAGVGSAAGCLPHDLQALGAQPVAYPPIYRRWERSRLPTLSAAGANDLRFRRRQL